jgi:hypothetical protein
MEQKLLTRCAAVEIIIREADGREATNDLPVTNAQTLAWLVAGMGRWEGGKVRRSYFRRGLQ